MTLTRDFDGAPPPGVIDFGVGQPSADLLPLGLLRSAADAFFRSGDNVDLNYGKLQGDARFREALADFLAAGYGETVVADQLLVTSGASQGLDLVCTQLTRPGDTVLVEEPTYFLAHQVFADHGLNVVGIQTDEDGLHLEHLESVLAHTKAALFYTIPSYHNPCGHTLPEVRRQRLVELSEQHSFLIVADEVYQLLNYEGTPPATFASRTAGRTVVSLGSFSKILAPALRLGWIQTSAPVLDRLMQGGVLRSGGSLNHFTSHIVREAIDSGLLAKHLQSLRKTLRRRVGAMDSALHREFGDIVEWHRPSGGYFFWLRFRDGRDVMGARKKALDYKTGFQPGAVFSSCDAFSDCLRLSFAHYDEQQISQGVARLARLFAGDPVA